MTELYNY